MDQTRRILTECYPSPFRFLAPVSDSLGWTVSRSAKSWWAKASHEMEKAGLGLGLGCLISQALLLNEVGSNYSIIAIFSYKVNPILKASNQKSVTFFELAQIAHHSLFYVKVFSKVVNSLTHLIMRCFNQYLMANWLDCCPSIIVFVCISHIICHPLITVLWSLVQPFCSLHPSLIVVVCYRLHLPHEFYYASCLVYFISNPVFHDHTFFHNLIFLPNSNCFQTSTLNLREC